DPEALEARVARLRHVLRSAVDPRSAVRFPHVAELGGQDHLVALALQGAAQQLLALAPAVEIGGVEEVDAEVQRAVDHRDGLRVVSLAVDVRHGHAAEADGGDRQCALPECALLHEILLTRRKSWIGYGDRFYPKTEGRATDGSRRDAVAGHRAQHHLRGPPRPRGPPAAPAAPARLH